MTISASLVDDLREAVASGGLSVAYQPQFALGPDGVSRTPAAVEGLCRWTNGADGDVPPATFIPLAERAHMVEEIDLLVLAQAAAQVARWQQAGHTVGLATNASPSHITFDYADGVISRLDELSIDPASVMIEITESPSPQLLPVMDGPLQRLRAFGVGISIDDFGSRDTTIEMIEALPIDEVKIDRSLTQRTDAAAAHIVEDVVDRARRHGWRVVAEGIETDADLARARAWGCDRGQGYLLGAPMDAEALERLLDA
ncbi:EAL domain-containing protein [Microbacterium sp.]|uniref:EAL domain-containing protein n=1 Tax=Microbacterium sp. TaxID=51671 RepID=UPI0035B136BB